MNILLRTTVLTCALAIASAAAAHDAKNAGEPPSALVKASYALPKNDGNQFRQTLHESDEENLQLKQQVAMDHADMYDILTAPEFDSKAFQAKMQDLRKQQDMMRSNRDDAIVAAVEQLTPAERKTLANGLEANAKYTAHHSKKVSRNDDSGSMQDAAPSAGGTVSQ